MNDKQFETAHELWNILHIARAHDRYLEPPPDITDGWPESDEMDLAKIERQKRIDREDWEAETLRQKQEDQS